MINAGDIMGAIQKLNCDVQTSENILTVVTKNIKKEIHMCITKIDNHR
jgi:hypothetical protein